MTASTTMNEAGTSSSPSACETPSAEQAPPARQEPGPGQPGELSFAALLQDTAGILVEVLRADMAVVGEVASDGKTLRQGILVRGRGGQLEALGAETLPKPQGKPLAAYALEKRDIVVSHDLKAETRFHDAALLEVGAASGFAVPLTIDRQPFAVLGALAQTRRQFTMADTLFVKAVGQQLAGLARRLKSEHLRRSHPAQDETAGLEEMEEQRSSPRLNYPYVQRIAPMHGSLIPSRDKFFKVQFRDLSAGGFSFYLPRPPDFESLVVSLGAPPTVNHYSARVVRVELIEEKDQNLYLVGCRFTGRVYF
ncbi:MAG TPA: GAF domain-containing protein [Planctomycetes bacterium]|nr:GAF domain-containing protein [Planctomycetota bacterium]